MRYRNAGANVGFQCGTTTRERLLRDGQPGLLLLKLTFNLARAMDMALVRRKLFHVRFPNRA